MNTHDMAPVLGGLFAELTTGTPPTGGFVLNRGDIGLLVSLDKLSAADASQAAHGGATIAAHAAHLAYGLSLMNRWASESGNPFADARWHEAWAIRSVDDARWQAIRDVMSNLIRQWQDHLASPREVTSVGLSGTPGSLVRLGYHLGAILQSHAAPRG